MAVIVTDNGIKREPTPTGAIPGVCTNVYDLGMQPGYEEGTFAHKIVISWELAEVMKEPGEFQGKRFVVSQTFTASLNEKANLRKVLESWRGRGFTAEELKGFDIEKVIGVPCLLNIVPKAKADGTVVAAIAAVMPLPKGIEVMVPELPRDHVPKWIQKLLGASVQQSTAVAPDDTVF
jgi:hypothetical protein